MFAKAFATSVAFATVATIALDTTKVHSQTFRRTGYRQTANWAIFPDGFVPDMSGNYMEFATGFGYQVTPYTMLQHDFDLSGIRFVSVKGDLLGNLYTDSSNNVVRIDNLSADNFTFNSPNPAIGEGSRASGQRSAAFGADAIADFDGSTAIGEGAVTTRANQIVLGRQSTEVTIPSLSGSGSGVLSAESDGTLRRLSVTGPQLESAINTKIPKLEDAAKGLGRAVQTSAAVSAAMSAVPDLTLQDDEPVRCGFGAGGSGSQYAAAAGCAARITERVHINGALSLAPSVDYGYGSTSSVAGRVGVSFPLGPINQAKSSDAQLIRQLQGENAKQSDLIRSQKAEIDQLRLDLARVLKRLEMD